MRNALIALGLTLASLAGCKGDRAKCEKAARHYSELVYWERADADIAKLPAERRADERKRRLAKFTDEVEKDIDFFIGQCVAANNDDQVDCMIEAKTGTEAIKCADLIKPK